MWSCWSNLCWICTFVLCVCVCVCVGVCVHACARGASQPKASGWVWSVVMCHFLSRATTILGAASVMVFVCVCVCVCVCVLACVCVFSFFSHVCVYFSPIHAFSSPNVCAWRCLVLFWCSEAYLYVVCECVCVWGCVTCFVPAGQQQIDCPLIHSSVNCPFYYTHWVPLVCICVCVFFCLCVPTLIPQMWDRHFEGNQ